MVENRLLIDSSLPDSRFKSLFLLCVGLLLVVLYALSPALGVFSLCLYVGDIVTLFLAAIETAQRQILRRILLGSTTTKIFRTSQFLPPGIETTTKIFRTSQFLPPGIEIVRPLVRFVLTGVHKYCIAVRGLITSTVFFIVRFVLTGVLSEHIL
jgi:hypothetical protein